MTPQENTAVATITIDGMHCPACANRVVKALQEVPGVEEAEVFLEKRQARVTYTPGQANPEALQQAVIKAGYTVESVTAS